jgi:spore coat polysaccharide biosynthesis protein SpsF
MRKKVSPLIFRADGGSKRGMGHIFRVVELMSFLRHRWKIPSLLVLRADPDAARVVRRAGIAFRRIRNHASEQEEARRLNSIGQSVRSRALVLDVLDTRPERIRILRCHFRAIVTLDDRGDGSALCDAVVHMLTRPRRERKRSAGARVHSGPRFVVVRREFLACRRRPIAPVARHFVISIGGADPAGLSVKVARACLAMDFSPRVTLVQGPAFRHRAAAEKLARTAKSRLRLVRSPARLAPHLARADIAVVSGGMGAYEAAAMGIPTVAICQTEAEWRDNVLREVPFVVSLGIGARLSGGKMEKAFRRLALDRACRRMLRRRALRAIDGRGLERVAKIIAGCCHSDNA